MKEVTKKVRSFMGLDNKEEGKDSKSWGY
jgi:hypothetical protein